MLTSLKKQILQKSSYKYLSNNSNQILDNYNNINKFKNVKKFVFKKFCIKIDFKFRDNLIYYFDENNICLRLCISRSTKKIFKTIYNDNYYFNYYCCFARIYEIFFIS